MVTHVASTWTAVKEKSEDAKQTIRNRKFEARQYHGKTKKTKKTYNDLQNTTQKHKPHKNSGELKFSQRLNSSCSTYWYPSCYYCLKSGFKSWVRKRLHCDYDKQNIFVFICDTYIPWPSYVGDYLKTIQSKDINLTTRNPGSVSENFLLECLIIFFNKIRFSLS